MPAGNEELIREYVDRGRFASDTAFIVKEVGIARKAYEELAKAKISIQGSTKLPDIAAGIKDAEKASQALIKTQNEILKQKKLQVSLENEVLKQQKLQQVAADKLAKTKPAATTISVTNLPNTDGINKTTTALNALDIEQAQAANSATALGQSQIVLNKSLKQTTQSALELNKQAELKKQLDRQAAQELKNVVREENAVKGSLEQRRAALIRLNAVYDNQAPAERASASGQRLQKIIGGLDTQVKTLENTTGRSQRNVGNYGSAFDGITKGATKAFSALRFLANIIPGLGIGGLILALADPIISLTKSLFGFNEVSEKTKQQQEEIASSFKQAADNAGEEISKVTVLKTVLESDNSTRLQKITALKQLKEINVDYFGQLDIENGKVNGLSLAYDFYVSRLIRSINAKANIDLLTKALKEQNDIVGDLNKNNVQKDGPFNVKNLTEFQRFDAIRRFNIKFGEERKSGNKDEKNATLISPAQDQLIVDLLNAEVKVKSITDKIKDDVVNAFDPKKEKTTTTKKDGSLQALKEVEDGEFERYKKRQEEIIKTFEDLTSNEKLSYDERIAALQNYSNAVLALDKKQEVEDIRIKTEAATREKNRLEEEKKGKDPAQIARLAQNQKIINDNLDDQIKTIKNNSAVKEREVFKTNEKKFDEITKQAYEARAKAIEEAEKKENQVIEDARLTRKGIIEKDYSDNVQFLNQRFADGKITLRQYNKDREKLDKEYHLVSLGAEIKYTKDVLYLMQLRGVDVKKELAALAKLEIEYSDLKKKNNEEEIKILDKVVSAYGVLKDTISGALNASSTKRKNEIEEEIKGIEKRRDVDLAANEARVQSDQDRAANAIIINARAQSQKEQLERKQREIDIQKAKAEKALAIFTITLSTAQNIARAKDPFSAILAGISGAAQLAIAIATPIPKFYRGKNAGNNYEGLGTVNDNPDGRTMEVIERADGSIEMPTGRNHLTYLGATDKVHPDKEAWLNGILGAANRDAAGGMRKPQIIKEDKVGNAILEQTKLLKMIANKPTQRTHADRNGLVNVINYGANERIYLENQTNWH